MEDYPHITVATVIPKDGKFLMVKERSSGELVINQPAGHLEIGENLIDAAIRESLEETTWQIEVSAFLGIYHFRSPNNGITYVRHCFVGQALQKLEDATLDPDIEESLWLSAEEIRSGEYPLRSPLVLAAVEDYLAKPHYPLSLLTD